MPEKFGDWEITIFRQVKIKPYGDFCAMGWRRAGNKKYGVNAEGATAEEAVRRLKARLESKA